VRSAIDKQKLVDEVQNGLARPADGSIVPPMYKDFCRFHPRCQVFASGKAAAAGIAESCTSTLVQLLPASPEPQVACHLARS
jgi:hypothetical protein